MNIMWETGRRIKNSENERTEEMKFEIRKKKQETPAKQKMIN